jgi:2-isopropylmalate synthase
LGKIEIYDTTLRDGAQSEDIAFSFDDKCAVVQKLDNLGVDFIEAGWPGANPKDDRLFKFIKRLKIKNARIMAFGSTCKPGSIAENDSIINALVDSNPDGVTIFGKSWDFHVRKGLRCSLKENLRIIRESTAYLKGKCPLVFFDAEHFFDGFKANREFALATLKAAVDGGADRIVLCDTNGGSLPVNIFEVVEEVKKHITTGTGIHCHNDGDLAVANSISAINAGALQVHGTINGIGERCGNTNLCSLIPALSLKMGYETIPKENLVLITEVSRFFEEIANLSHNKHQPYVGKSAFAHKGGMHVSAILNEPESYEHINPLSLGNQRKVLVSELSGKSNILFKAREFNLDLSSDKTATQEIVKIIKDLEDSGFQFEGADASLELLMKKAVGMHTRYFKLKGFRVITDKRSEGTEPLSEATIMIDVDGNIEHTAALGNGPVNALDNALRKALRNFYPKIKEVKLLDYKVRVVSSKQGTESVVRVLIESGDKSGNWNTVGVSSNIIEASWMALVDSMDYKLFKDLKS